MTTEVDKFILRDIFIAVSSRRPATSTTEIKARFAQLGLTITAAAEAIHEDRTYVSHVIAYRKASTRVREKLEQKYKIRFQPPQQKAA